MELIYPFSFATINHNRLEKEGFPEGTVVFVAGVKAVPLNKDDPYTQRIIFAIQKVVDEKIDDEGGFHLVDPTSLKLIDKEEQKIYRNVNGIEHPKDDDETSTD